MPRRCMFRPLPPKQRSPTLNPFAASHACSGPNRPPDGKGMSGGWMTPTETDLVGLTPISDDAHSFRQVKVQNDRMIDALCRAHRKEFQSGGRRRPSRPRIRATNSRVPFDPIQRDLSRGCAAGRSNVSKAPCVPGDSTALGKLSPHPQTSGTSSSPPSRQGSTK